MSGNAPNVNGQVSELFLYWNGLDLTFCCFGETSVGNSGLQLNLVE